MRPAAAVAAVAAAGLLLSLVRAGGAWAGEADPVMGAGGWASERFGEGVAILRAPITAASGAGYLLLSCEGAERRFRLALPAPIALPSPARPGMVRGGTILLRGSGRAAPGPGRIVAAVALSGDRVLSRAEAAGSRAGSSGSVVTAVADLLRSRPARLDLLFRPDGVPRLPRWAVPLVLTMVWRDGDVPAIDDFRAACGG